MTLTKHEIEKLRDALAMVVDTTPSGCDFEDLEQVRLRPAPPSRRSGFPVAVAVAGFVTLVVFVAPFALLFTGGESDQTVSTVSSTVSATSPVEDTGIDSSTTDPFVEDGLRPVADELKPDRFPIVTDEWSTAATSSASWGGQLAWDNPISTEALVARVDGSWLRDGIRLSVMTGNVAGLLVGISPGTATVAGVEVEVYVDGGSPTITTVVLPGVLTMTATGLDPLAFLEAAGGFPIEGARLNDDNEVEFTVGSLPEGYSVVAPPTRLPLGSVEAWTNGSDGDGGDGIIVAVGLRSSLVSAAPDGDLQRVDVNGVDGWMHDRGPGSTVIWPLSDTTWATVAGAATVDQALAFARSLEFVDEATWTEYYNVEEPRFPPRNEGAFLGASQFRVVATGQSNASELGALSQVQSQDELSALLLSFQPEPEISMPDFAKEIVIAFTVPDADCDTPLRLLGFAQASDGSYTPRIDEETTRSCRLVLIPTTFVVAVNSAAWPPGSALRLPADDQYGYPDASIEITQ